MHIMQHTLPSCNAKLLIMDNLENCWGVEYVVDNSNRRSSSAAGEANVDVSTFQKVISDDLGSAFSALHFASCGSIANLWAINDATGCDTSSCLIAAGSHVAGDGGPLQPYSSSKFDLSDPHSSITPPEEVKSPIGRKNTVALPCYIPRSLSTQQLRMHEDECLNSLNVVLQRAGMAQKPCKALFLELLLAGNGCTLSDRCLIHLATICRLHKVRIIVDEILTGARTALDKFLLCQTKPKEFRDVITHVTLGKWLKIGVVLCSKTFAKERELLYGFGRRGVSTQLCLNSSLQCWKNAHHNIKKGTVKERRRLVLEHLSVDEENSWGEGCIIFAPVARTNAMQGLKIRYLPKLCDGLKIDRIQKKKSRAHTRACINSVINSGILPVFCFFHGGTISSRISQKRLRAMPFIFLARMP